MPRILRQRVRPRDIWKHEAQDFTPWLVENLSWLAECLNIDLELEAIEQKVSEFRADIVCRNTTDNSRIVIENQLNRTDHAHLGQVLTYAAGLEAYTIVWIATEFRAAHRVTMCWHNEITDRRFSFFGLELDTWMDDASRYLAQLNIVSEPDDWSRLSRPRPYQIHRQLY